MGIPSGFVNAKPICESLDSECWYWPDPCLVALTGQKPKLDSEESWLNEITADLMPQTSSLPQADSITVANKIWYFYMAIGGELIWI